MRTIIAALLSVLLLVPAFPAFAQSALPSHVAYIAGRLPSTSGLFQRRLSRRLLRMTRPVRTGQTPMVPAPSATYDTQTDSNVRSNFLLLGSTSAALAGVRVFSEVEPLDVTSVTVKLTSEVPSIEAFLVYDHDRRFLGRARLDTTESSNTEYVLEMKNGTFVLPKRENVSLYVRAFMKAFEQGGESGGIAQVQKVTIAGDGVWSHRPYMQPSTVSFPAFQITRSLVMRIENAGGRDGGFVTGQGRLLASFLFAGEKGDGAADLRFTGLSFQIEQVGGVTLSNVRLQDAATAESLNCSSTVTTVTCASVPATIGSFGDEPRVVRVYGDVSVSPGALNPHLRLTLNEPGDVSTAGSVSWTDGTTTFIWVPFEQPVAEGTLMR